MKNASICAVYMQQSIDEAALDYLRSIMEGRGFDFKLIQHDDEFESFARTVQLLKEGAVNNHLLITEKERVVAETTKIEIIARRGTAIFCITDSRKENETLINNIDGIEVFEDIDVIISYFDEIYRDDNSDSADIMDSYTDGVDEPDLPIPGMSRDYEDVPTDVSATVEPDLPIGREDQELPQVEEVSRVEPAGLKEEQPIDISTPTNVEKSEKVVIDECSSENEMELVDGIPPRVESSDTTNYIQVAIHSDEELRSILKNITEVRTTPEQREEVKEAVEIKVEEKKDEKEVVSYQENPYYTRSKNIQRQLFARQQFENHRMIGVWSPLHRMGVTSFVMNFSFFLAQNRVYTAVLEGLTNQHALKDILQRYTSTPKNWISYAQAIQDSVDNPMDAAWIYKNVTFLPLSPNDLQYDWHDVSLESYMSTTKIIDVTLVDLPTGEMEKYTKDSLHYLDELWIVVDDSIQEIVAWKKYIEQLKKQTGLTIYLVFNKEYPFSQTKRIAKELDMKLLTSIPSLHEETMKNYYEITPLFFHDGIHQVLEQPFNDLANHLFSGDFTIKEKQQVHSKSMKDKILQPFKLMWGH